MHYMCPALGTCDTFVNNSLHIGAGATDGRYDRRLHQ